MAGGIYPPDTENKVRPGAYINVTGRPKAPNPNNRGVVMMATLLAWFAHDPDNNDTNPCITLTRDQFNSNEALALIGTNYEQSDRLATTLKLIYRNAYTVVLVGMNKPTGRAKSSDEKVTAKNAGTFGNRLTVTIVKSQYDDTYNVNTLLDGRRIEILANVKTAADVTLRSKFISLADNYALANNAGITLSGGTDTGEIQGDLIENMRKFASEIQNIQVMYVDDIDESANTAEQLTDAVTYLIEQAGVNVTGMYFGGYEADSEYMCRVYNQGFVKDGVSYDAMMWLALNAGMYAGADEPQSNTYRQIDADSIINPIPNDEVAFYLQQGYLIMTKTQDGKIVLEQDINTLTTLTPTKGDLFRKNRAIRTIRALKGDFRSIWENDYAGKVTNNDQGRDMYRASMSTRLKQREAAGSIEGFTGNEQTDLIVLPGDHSDSVKAGLYAKILDSMEKVYIDMSVGQ